MAVTLTWSGGEHDFDLKIAQLRALQDRCDAGPAWVLARLSSGQWRVDDILETLRLGLEGGGMDKKEARRLVQMHVEEALAIHVITAQAVLMAALYGDPDDPIGSPKGEATGETVNPSSPEESSDGASSSETQLSLDLASQN